MKRMIAAAAGSGLAVAGLSCWLYAAALDEKNLLTPFHPLELLLWAVTAVAVAALLWGVRKCDTAAGTEASSGVAAAMGCFALAAALVVEVLPYTGYAPDLMEKLCLFGGVLTAPGMVWVGFCRLRGKQPFFGCHALLCVWVCLRLVVNYRAWSGDPQLMDYIFPMLASVCLGLFAYQLAARDVGTFSPRGILGWGLLTVFSCAASLGSTSFLFYAAGAFWALTALCRLSPVPGSSGDSGKE